MHFVVSCFVFCWVRAGFCSFSLFLAWFSAGMPEAFMAGHHVEGFGLEKFMLQ